MKKSRLNGREGKIENDNVKSKTLRSGSPLLSDRSHSGERVLSSKILF